RRAVYPLERLPAAEDGADVRRLLVARPALEHPELARVVDSDVERGVAPFGEAAQDASGAGAHRSIPGVDRADDVTGDKCLPALVRPDAVRPLLVRERAARAERHDEDQRSNPLLRE